ncbi:hypothetical protein [Rhodothermus profundi]|uniref:Uncharacterized protein n=1 Tax=Rhodothermus profundi TaxID=633813 RepID=A0A1M6RDE1_9BACT|nr:hypothetical protein [Rhodothermus profundi]SHK30505.1 hypothetical protein SAMN04488087_0803 [Rhodothermus profundi]
MKLKGEPAFSDLPMKTLIGWGLLLLGVGGCKLIGVAEERAVILTAGPAQILVENRTGWPLCVWMLDEQTASVIDIGFEPCTAPNVATGETKIFPVYIPEGEPGIRMIVFWAPFQQNTWRWQRIWVPASKLGLQAIFGQ